jgi:arginine metabolism regulation protein II
MDSDLGLLGMLVTSAVVDGRTVLRGPFGLFHSKPTSELAPIDNSSGYTALINRALEDYNGQDEDSDDDDDDVNENATELTANDLENIALTKAEKIIERAHDNTMGKHSYVFQTLDGYDSIHISSLFNHLVTYYKDTLSVKMMSVGFKKNPWTTLFLPKALLCIGGEVTFSATPSSRWALLYAMLSISCFRLQSEYKKNSIEMTFFLDLGVRFRLKASKYLREVLDNIEQEKYKDVICALLSMSSIDVVWGIMADCQYHIGICEDLAFKRYQTRPRLSKKALVLSRVITFMKYIGDSTSTESTSGNNNFGVDVNFSKEFLGKTEEGQIYQEILNQRGLAEFVPTEGPFTQHEPQFLQISADGNVNFTFETLYAIPNSFSYLFQTVVRLYKIKQFLDNNKRNNTTTKNDMKQQFKLNCMELEERLLNWKMEWKLVDCSGICSNKGQESLPFISPLHAGVFHHIMSRYNSLLIYYFKIIRNYSDIHLQSYCESTYRHLERMMELRQSHNVPLLTCSWSAFIAGCSCLDEKLQIKFKAWFEDLSNIGMGSYWGTRQIMFEVWRRRKTGEKNDDWMSVHKEWETGLMLS